MFEAAANWAAANCTDAVPVDTPPEVTLTSPATGATVQGVVTFSADATDDHGVFRVVFAVDGTAFETDSNGTNGWTGSWSSTAVADGPHTISATATDTAGQTDTSSITVTVANSTSPKVLMVVAAPTARTAPENVVAQRLTTGGYDVTFADDNTVTAADTSGKAFVLVAQSTAAAQATNVLRNLAVPVWVAKPYLFDDFGLTGTVEGVDYGFKAASPAHHRRARPPDGGRPHRHDRRSRPVTASRGASPPPRPPPSPAPEPTQPSSWSSRATRCRRAPPRRPAG